jgi:molybdopterin/thiamine biosynthesis adenylyltransferase
MSRDNLTREARLENALMLASVLSLKTEAADKALQFEVCVTAEVADATAMAIAYEFVTILRRTIRDVHLNTLCKSAVMEVVIGRAAPQSPLPKLFLGMTSEEAVIGEAPTPWVFQGEPGVIAVLTACYLSAAVIRKVLGTEFPYGGELPMRVSFGALGIDFSDLGREIEVGELYLAGAGAIGNGLLWALRHLKLRGRLIIVDDDTVSSGNLNRQIWFTQEDIRKPKAEQLAMKAQSFMPALKLVPRRYRLQDLPERSEEPWLKRLIVGVDSRRARREIQKEFPGEVFDASTTDIREIVVHYHKQPTGTACLSCIYESDDEEISREAHIAEHLGVSTEEVRTERITEAAADKIFARYPKLDRAGLVGFAYDSLFKRLCGEGELKSLEGRRVVAPFAFVSILAGTLLALEIVRRLGDGDHKRAFNYWRISPWYGPILRRQILRPKQPGCEFCSHETLARINRMLWPAATP